MAKRVFKYGELTQKGNNIVLKAPFEAKKEEYDEVLEIEQYTGPTVEELKADADNFKEAWEIEKNKMIEKSRIQAEQIIENAKSEEEQLLEEAKVVATQLVKDAEDEKVEILNKAKTEALETLKEAHNKENEIIKEFRELGEKEGYEKGFSKGEEDASRVLNKLQIILSEVVTQKGTVIEELEEEIIDLVLQISRKVIKTISENQKGVVIENIRSALKKLKNKTSVVIRVNTNDLDLTNKNIKSFIDGMEKVNNVTVIEDALVDIGGCIIETDNGEIDARIKSQLRQVEKAILDVIPISQEK